MTAEYGYDLYPRDDPKDGTRLIRYTFEDLIAAEYRDVIGVGSGSAVIWHDHAGAEHIDSRGEQYVRVVRLGGTEKVVGGFWTSKMPFETAIASERRHLTISGPGQMAYLARAVMAPHTYVYDVFNGQDPYDGIFRLSEQSTIFAGGPFLGAMLWRVIYEAQHFRVGTTPYSHIHAGEDDFGELVVDIHDDDRTVSRIPEVTMGFDQLEDSDGNAWTLTAGEFTAQVGENVLGVVQRLMQAGLFIWMDPDTFTLHAWEGRPATRLGRSTDRTGASWGANVVRFQSPTDGTIATGSILSDANRVVNSYLPRGPIWVGGNDIYVKDTGATDALYEGFVHSSAEDPDALAQIGAAQSTARQEAADVGQLKLKLGSDPTNGYYLPGEHLLLDELVRVNTGTGEFDYDEANYPVGAWRVSLAPDGAEWLGFAELGSSYDEALRREFAIPSTPGHTHPSNLCQPTTSPSTTAATIDYEWSFQEDMLDDHLNAVAWGGASHWGGPGIGVMRWSGTATAQFLHTTAPVGAKLDAGEVYTLKIIVVGKDRPQQKRLQMVWLDGANNILRTDVLTENLDVGTYEFTMAAAPALTGGFRINIYPPEFVELYVSYVGIMHGGGVSSGGATGSGHIELIGICTDIARCCHKHHVNRDRPPGADDDAVHGYPKDTFWIYRADPSDPDSPVGGFFVSTADATGAAVWQVVGGGGGGGGGSHDHTAAATTYDNTTSGLAGTNLQDAVDELAATPAVVGHGAMGAAETFTFTDGTDHEGTQDANLTVTLAGATNGEAAFMTLKLAQDATGGHTLTLPASVANAADIEAAWDTTASAVNVLTVFSYDGGTIWYAALMGSTSAAGLGDGRWVPVSIDPAGDEAWEILFDDAGSVVMMEVYD